jgi:hypothetical protein
MYKNFNLTESEKNQIRGLYEQPAQDTIMGIPLSQLGLNSLQVLKDKVGNVVGRYYIGNDGNKGYTVKIMNDSNTGIVFDPTNNTTKTVPLQQLVVDFKSRTHDYISGILAKGSTAQPQTTYMSDDNVAKLNASINQAHNKPLNEEMEDVDLGNRLANDSASDFPNNNPYGENMKVIRKITQDINVGPNGIGGGPSPDNFNKIAYAIDLAVNKYGNNYSRDDVANALYHALYGFDDEDNTPQPNIPEKSKVRDEMPTHAEDAYNSAMGLGKPSDYYRDGGYEDLSGRDD